MALIIVDHLHGPGCAEFVSLKHPSGDGSVASFAFLTKDESSKRFRLVELHRLGEDASSCFVGNTVRKNATLNSLLDVDPNLFLLHLLEQERCRTVPLNQLLRVEGFPHYSRIVECDGANIECLADVQGTTESGILVRLNEEKCLGYLQKRVTRVTAYLLEKIMDKAETLGTADNFNGPTSSQVSLEKQSQLAQSVKQKEAERVALQLLFDYLGERWRSKLADRLGWTVEKIMSTEPFKGDSMQQDVEKPAVALSWEEENGYLVPGGKTIDQMRFGTCPDLPGKAQGNQPKRGKMIPAPLTSAQKKLVQVNKKGIPSISSFFSSSKPGA